MNQPPIPERANLVAECCRVLTLRLRAGEWAEVLPGERRLADLLQVGRDTIRAALERLEAEQLISSAKEGRRRKILEKAYGPARPEEAIDFKVGMLSPFHLERLQQAVVIELDHIRNSLAAKNVRLELFSPPWYEQARPQKHLMQFLSEEKRSVWLLYRASSAIQQTFEKAKVPCLVRGYPLPDSKLPHIDVDWRATARHAATRLWQIGHRRVAVIAASDSLAGVDAAVDGVNTFNGEGFCPSMILEDGSVDGLIRQLSRALLGPSAPTALIATRPRQAATAMTWLASQGLKVPEQMSILTLSREPYLEHLVPRISGYRIDPAAVARLVIRRLERLARSGTYSDSNPWLIPAEIKGESLAKPRD